MTQPRSSLAIALQDYKGIRPGIALTIAAVALMAAIGVGAVHIVLLGRSAATIQDAGQTIRTMHRYDAALEVWRQMATDAEGSAVQGRLRDSIALALRSDLANVMDATTDTVDRNLIGAIVRALTPAASGQAMTFDLASAGREQMILLRGRQDDALFAAAAASQRSQIIGALLIALTVIAAGILIIPMSWVYVRYKRGVPPGL
ncbi:MAG: hypothetical protein WD934_02725 [Gemmatimonadales bacterium]